MAPTINGRHIAAHLARVVARLPAGAEFGWIAGLSAWGDQSLRVAKIAFATSDELERTRKEMTFELVPLRCDSQNRSRVPEMLHSS